MNMISMASAIGEWENRQESKQLFISNNGRKNIKAKWLCNCDNCRMNRRIDKSMSINNKHIVGDSVSERRNEEPRTAIITKGEING